MAKKMDMIRYVFENRPNEMRKMVIKYGVSPAQNPDDLWKKINYIIKTFPQDAIKDIVSVHPDKDIICKVTGLQLSQPSETNITSESPISTQDIKNLQNDSKSEDKKSGACGCGGSSGCDGGSCKCGGSCGSKKSNAVGDTTTTVPTTSQNNLDKPVSAEGAKWTSNLQNNLPLVVIGSLIVIGGFLILNKKIS